MSAQRSPATKDINDATHRSGSATSFEASGQMEMKQDRTLVDHELCSMGSLLILAGYLF